MAVYTSLVFLYQAFLKKVNTKNMITEISAPHKLLSFEKIETNIYTTAEEACNATANEIAALIKLKQRNGQKAVLGLATGSTPKKVYEALIRLHTQNELSFKNVVTFNLDEYYSLQPDALQSYRRFMEENLFNHIDIEKANCFIPHGGTPPEIIKMHCEDYEKRIEEFGGIDFQLLGIGRNGHIGFNEPGSHVSSATRLITLDHLTRFDAAYEFGSLANVPRKAITMGVGSILRAKRIVLLAWGERKATIIQQAVEGPVTEFIPASYLQGHQNVTFVLDESAAAELTRKKTPWLTDDVVWNNGMIKKAVTHLALALNKPILKLTNNDYNQNGLSDLLALYGQAYDINIEVFNQLQRTITGWPGGKPKADDTFRPERAMPESKRVLIFSPHPDDDIISMGGTFQRLVDQGHEVYVAYQTSGNIAVADDEAFRFIDFIKDYNQQFGINSPAADKMYDEALAFLKIKKNGEKDIEALRLVKGNYKTRRSKKYLPVCWCAG
jgi:glucosamine-6-phosphate deaminase